MKKYYTHKDGLFPATPDTPVDKQYFMCRAIEEDLVGDIIVWRKVFLSGATELFDDKYGLYEQYIIEGTWVAVPSAEVDIKLHIPIYQRLAAKHGLPLLKENKDEERWDTADDKFFLQVWEDKWYVGAWRCDYGNRETPPEVYDVEVMIGNILACLRRILVEEFNDSLHYEIYPEE